jgi:uncharacterized protein (TIGR03435 family)
MPAFITRRNTHKFDWVQTVLLSAAGVLASGNLMNPPRSLAQSASTPTPTFEVAAIRHCEANVPAGRSGGLSWSPGRLSINCGTLKLLIQQAYVTYANGRFTFAPHTQIEGGPSWIDSDHYDINAKAEDNVSREIMNGPMMEALLEDRFKLKIHRETREVPVYALTVAKSGFKLHQVEDKICTPVDLTMAPVPSVSGAKPPCESGVGLRRILVEKGLSFTLTVKQTSLDMLFKTIPPSVLDRPVINKTGITGTFSFHLDFSADETMPALLPEGGVRAGAMPDPVPDPSVPSIFTALEEQLGLKLEKAKGPQEVLVIDRLERPSEN